jgi:hypothetical protein
VIYCPPLLLAGLSACRRLRHPRSSRAYPVRPVVGLSFIQVRLRSAPGPLVGFPDRGHPAGLATDGEPAQDEVEGGRAHGVGVVIAEDASAAGQDVFVQLPGRLGTRPARSARRRGGRRTTGCRGCPRPGRGGGPGCLRPAPGPPGTRRPHTGRFCPVFTITLTG